ncbi:MAG: GNAT family N-acetyltransferase [Prevotellaceae bacterium]|nr:GNAT family N-acetyltransferase [Prevotellaceae bacterium]
MDFILLDSKNTEAVKKMSAMATNIVREHYDPILGTEQNDYMLKKFQSEHAILQQIADGYRYYFIQINGNNIGFIAIIPHSDCMYLSKLYLYKHERGKGYSRQIIGFIAAQAQEIGLHAIELNVNRFNPSIRSYEALGFQRVRAEKNDIGNGYFMDDYVYRLTL